MAVIGLGTMGRPMARRLLAAGHTVTGHDPDPAALAEVAEHGAQPAPSARTAAHTADVVITMLPKGSHVLAATTGPDGALAGMRPGSVLVDMSTIDPATSARVNTEATAQGVRMLDAPVSGSSTGATDGTLTIMVGGPAEVLAAAHPILSVLGQRIIHCGPAGSGVAVKLANQVMAGAAMVAVAEAFLLAEQLGINPNLLFDVATTSSGDCWALRTRPPVPGIVKGGPADNDFAPGFKGALMSKDLLLALDTARGAGIRLPLTEQAHELYALMGEKGFGDKDFSAVFTALRE
ncbi:3-hydroxyisobutyrate dehydrogenase [Actinokineospora sp. NBRC 105648]|uniref:3-hydroxyisobutyrate dehydrogenase n=1 Tax=Actinokineospora sp. NBRC 105648 TaxID=3032206 RepID=UPI0024A102ED|nr:3-hydroxyisobutyrate dehydrogenase [Actinokineospora sp. NBRC 105648]GLZ39320.1 3-hydroxyisobutyrate dehydrogenase [Actinokineospora sp. NBRC 105648]